jgi:hypothetical protein
MAVVAPLSRLLVGEVGWYLGSVKPGVAAPFARGGLPLVLSGVHGPETGRRLRVEGCRSELLLDPGQYEASVQIEEADATLFELPVDWEAIQRQAGASALLSPGRYVPGDDRDELVRCVEAEVEWVDGRTDAFVQLAVHWSWLTGGRVAVLADALSGAGRVVLMLADSNDPLSKAGAVAGLAELIDQNSNVALSRCDLGALGAVARGAMLGCIGITGTLRHVVPPGKTSGGIPHDRSPSVFNPATLCWLKGSKLAGSGSKGPICELPGCDGQPLSRFWEPQSAPAAIAHNQHAVEAVVTEVLRSSPESRFSTFQEMCAAAEHAAVSLQATLKQTEVAVSPQRAAWATLGE